MKEITKKNLCTGCSLCCNICPKDAIKMVVDDEGFKYPVIDDKKCINCGLCHKMCPNNHKEQTNIKKCYACYNKNEESLLNKSSSGGLFEVFANYYLSIGGIVIGAAFDENNKLKHIPISSKKDLEKLKGSKYLQSDIENIYKYIKENINEKKILFVGTPCQVAGIKTFIKNDNLFCIDLVCHGVPSQSLYDSYINYLENENNNNVYDFNFRDKETGWNDYSISYKVINKKHIEKAKNNKYIKLFLSNYALRKSCYNCNFKIDNKYSDITLGDFWGIEKIDTSIYNKNGTSLLLINSKKGEELFNIIKSKINCKEFKVDDVIKYNSSLVYSPKIPKERLSFYNDLNNNKFNKVYKKYNILLFKRKIKNKLKIHNDK